MTEQEWLTSTDPATMLEFLTGSSFGPLGLAREEARIPKPSDRKLRLFACGCVRQVWHLLEDERSQQAVLVAERYADGAATDEELAAARSAAGDAAWDAQASLLRDIVGNPFRPVTLAACNCGSCVAPGRQHHNGPCAVRRLRTPTARAIAQAAYDERDLVMGHLDPLTLAALADALEEAGCKRELCQECGGSRRIWVDYPPVEPHWNGCHDCDCGLDPQSFLGHLRSPGPHVRGCWAVDLILGKE